MALCRLASPSSIHWTKDCGCHRRCSTTPRKQLYAPVEFAQRGGALVAALCCRKTAPLCEPPRGDTISPGRVLNIPWRSISFAHWLLDAEAKRPQGPCRSAIRNMKTYSWDVSTHATVCQTFTTIGQVTVMRCRAFNTLSTVDSKPKANVVFLSLAQHVCA